MATFVLIHGGGSSRWDWHLVAPLLEAAGHATVAVDLPTEDPAAGWERYVDVVAQAAAGAARPLVVVGHSLGGFTAPLVADRLRADLLVLLAAMIPAPGEVFGDWWSTTGHATTGDEDLFFHDVPPELAAESATRSRGEDSAALGQPWPLRAWPAVPTRYALFQADRMFPPEFARRHARERLDVVPDELPGGHYALLSEPEAVAAYLASCLRS